MKNHNSPKSPNRLKKTNSGGFSLIELVIAMTFLTIVILGVANLQTGNLGMMNGQKNQVQAHFLAVQGAQIVQGLGYAAADAAFSGCGDPAACFKIIDNSSGSYQILSAPPESITIGNQNFLRKIQIASDNTNLPSAYKIRSIVEWEDSTGNHSLVENTHVETDLIVFN